MNRGSRLHVSILALALLSMTGWAYAADEKKPAAPEMPPEMAEYMKLAQPGEHHAHMAKMVGSWKAHSKFVMAPGAPPEESDGTMTARAVLDGRFFLSEYSSTMMGQPFNGIGMDGYDNYKKKHVSIWADSMGTMVLMFEGTCTQGGKVTEMRARFEDPVTKKMTDMRTLTTVKDDNTILFEMFGPGQDGKETRMGEITYTRK